MKSGCSIRQLLVPALCLMLAGCESLGYYSQAVLGQLSILSKREDIEALIDDVATPQPLKDKLTTILDIRRFAETELLLPVDDNYATYVDVEQPFVVWNVFAAPEFSLRPQSWCYPIAGCVTYRGYFKEARARQYASRLQAQGLDVYVGGVSAYSTLGWFSDPVLSTVINREDYRLAALLFHELAHQQVYVPGDTEFNESFATAIEQEGLRRWLRANQINQARSQQIIEQAHEDSERREEFVALVIQTATRLESLYATDDSPESKRKNKAAILCDMKNSYSQLKKQWGGYTAYDGWMSQDLNNAQFSMVSTYFNWMPAFERLLQEQDNDLAAFYQEVAALEQMDAEQRSAALAAKLY
jgi:predicted aminopeptidase